MLCIMTILLASVLTIWALIGNGSAVFLETKTWNIVYIILITPGLITSIRNLPK